MADLSRLKAALRAHRPDPDLPIDALRAKMRTDAEALPVPDGISVEVLDAGGVPAELVQPADAGADGAGFTVLYLHGGGYCCGSASSVRGLAGRLALAGPARVLALDYRLAPEHPYPAGRDDAVTAYRWLLDGGTDPSRIVIAGDSAGGGLAVVTALALRDAGTPVPGAVVSISPWADVRLASGSVAAKAENDPIVTLKSLERFAEYYTGGGDRSDPGVSPVLADLSGLPRLLIQVGEDECLVDDAEELAARAKACGVEVTLEVWPEMVHVWHLLAPRLEPANQAIERIARWVGEPSG
ncbi:MAG TPA: alpha/beta hydrolase [Pseudonocardia sp.]|jgi:acetyl esterase/lipase|nr:alpha/beta hydrolase [Pseudonocardia sp.]